MNRSANLVATEREAGIRTAIENRDKSALRALLDQRDASPDTQELIALLHTLNSPSLDWQRSIILQAAIGIATAVDDLDPMFEQQLCEVARQLLGSSDPVERAAGAEGIGWFGSQDDSEALVLLASTDEDPLVRVCTLDALARVEPDAARSLIPRRLDDEQDSWVRASLKAHEFVSCLTETVPSLEDLLEQGFDVVGNFLRTVGDLLSDRLPEPKRADLLAALRRLKEADPPVFVAESVTALIDELTQG